MGKESKGFAVSEKNIHSLFQVTCRVKCAARGALVALPWDSQPRIRTEILVVKPVIEPCLLPSLSSGFDAGLAATQE